MDPVPLSLIGGGIGGLLGAIKAKKANKEAERRDRLKSALAVNDAQFASFGKGKSNQYATPMEKQSMLGATLGGAMSGALQGANVYKGLEGMNANKTLLSSLGAGPKIEPSVLGGSVTQDQDLLNMRSGYFNLSKPAPLLGGGPAARHGLLNMRQGYV